jgi:hypothetical protein
MVIEVDFFQKRSLYLNINFIESNYRLNPFDPYSATVINNW